MKKLSVRMVSLLLAIFIVLGNVPSFSVAVESDVKYEAESLPVTVTGNWNINRVNAETTDSSCSGGQYYFLQGGSGSTSWDSIKDLTASFPLGEIDAGQYTVYVRTKDNVDRGIYQFSVGGMDLGSSLDMYLPKTEYTGTYGSYVEHELGTVNHTGGGLVLDARPVGQNASASGKYGLVIDYIRLVKVGEAEVPNVYHMSFPPSVLTQGEALPQGITMSEGWKDSSYTGSVDTAGSVYSETVGSYVQFQPKDLEAGWYQVRFWNIANNQNPMKMTATVYADQTMDAVKPSVRTDNGWTTVGTYYFTGDDSEFFRLEVTTAGKHSRVADVQFVETEDPQYVTQVWDNTEDIFSSTGTWNAVEGVGHDQNGEKTTDGEATATWAGYPPATQSGNFSVYYWNSGAQDGETLAPVRLRINSLDGDWRVNLEPAKLPVGWVKVATVRAADDSAALTVTLSLTGDGSAYADGIKLVETAYAADPVYTPGSGGSDEPAVIVNQIGYDTGRSKRATVVNIDPGSAYQLVDVNTGKVAYEGTVAEANTYSDSLTGGIVDFTDFDTPGSYYITCKGTESYVFEIGKNLIYQRTAGQALDFMEQTRHDAFLWGVKSIGWRDSHQFCFELNSMALQYMANPAYYDSICGSVYEVDQCEYEALRDQAADEPNIVWLMKFAAMRYYDLSKNDGEKLHMLTKEQLAYFLYLYPQIKEWVSEEFYTQIRDLALEIWDDSDCTLEYWGVEGTDHNLYTKQTLFGGLKGSQPPGHSIVPNLMMYEVALRDGLGDDVAKRFFDAAYTNCAYLVSDAFDLTDPYYNKGQRMSERVTMTALAYFLEMYPDQAPAGLEDAIVEWANANLDRTDNLWDIRMAVAPSDLDQGYTFHTANQNPLTKTYWTGAAYALADGQSPAPKNEPGNQGGLQAAAYAAARVVTDEALQEKLKAMGNSAIDDLLGRNPTGMAAFYHFTRDFEGADKGWYVQFPGGNGYLGGLTAVIDANAPEATYPYAPENYASGYTEGWVAYNTAWNESLAYSSAEATSLSVSATSGKAGEVVTITLDAPLNQDNSKVETGYVWVTLDNGQSEKVTLTENAPAGTAFTGTYQLPTGTQQVTVSYGIGLFQQSQVIAVQGEVQPMPEIHSMDEMYKLTYTQGDEELLYRLYVPADYDASQEYPVLVYLNGAGSRGTDNEKQLNNLAPLMNVLIDNPDNPCIVVVPQLPTDQKWVNTDWTKGSYDFSSMPESQGMGLLMGLLDELQSKYSVDENRLYLMGQSFGGYGTWYALMKYPEKFAAAIAMCGAGDPDMAPAIKDIPLMVLHGDEDPTVPVSGSREMVDALKQAGSEVLYYEYAGDDHYVQRRIFEQPALWMDWLFAQEKGAGVQPNPSEDVLYFPKKTQNLNTQDKVNTLTQVSGGTATLSGEQLKLATTASKSSVFAMTDWGVLPDSGVYSGYITIPASNAQKDGGGGLVFRYQDSKNYLHVRLTADGVNLLEMANGSAVTNQNAEYNWKPGRIVLLTAVLQGSHLTVYADQVQVFDYQIKTQKLQSGGTAGVRYYSNALNSYMLVDDLIWSEQTNVTTLTISNLTDRQVIQRNVETQNAEVTFQGTWTGKQPQALTLTITPYDGGDAVVAPFQATVNQDGTWKAVATVPQGGWYKLQVTASDETEVESGRWGVGINLLMIGQSNMQGAGKPAPYVAADDRASNFMNEQWSHLEDPYGNGDTSISGNGNNCGASMAPALANALIARYDVPVGIIPAAKSGAGLYYDATWKYWVGNEEHPGRNPEDPDDRSTLYGNSIYRAWKAGGCEYIVMNGGEHDISLLRTQEEFQKDLETLIGYYREDLPGVPFVYCQLGACTASSWNTQAHQDSATGIRNAQWAVNDPDNGVYIAAVEMGLPQNSDQLHYTTQSQELIGQRVAHVIGYILGDESYYLPPTIQSVSFVDQEQTMLDVTVAHAGGDDLVGSGNYTGFEVFDADGPVEILSAVRENSNTIRITLKQAAVGATTLRYLYGLLPDVSNLVKDNSSLGLPLNSTPGQFQVEAYVPTHTHQLEHHQAQDATCTQNGNVEYWYCEGCGTYFTDEGCTQEITLDQTVVEATGHKTELQNQVEATCSQEGYTGDEVCTICNQVVKQGESIAKLPHDYHDGVCGNCGAEDPEYQPPTQSPEPTPSAQPSQSPEPQQTPEPTQTPVPENPNDPDTGDETQILWWVLLLTAAVLGIAVGRKMRKNCCK